MVTLTNTPENAAKVKALKLIKETQWTGTVHHPSLHLCLAGLNLETTNSGWYVPVAVKISGLTGYFMLNQDGSLFCEARVIKVSDNRFNIEYMTNSAWGEFERAYSDFINQTT